MARGKSGNENQGRAMQKGRSPQKDGRSDQEEWPDAISHRLIPLGGEPREGGRTGKRYKQGVSDDQKEVSKKT